MGQLTVLAAWSDYMVGPPGVLGIWEELQFIFRELGSTGNYFQGFEEQADISGI